MPPLAHPLANDAKQEKVSCYDFVIQPEPSSNDIKGDSVHVPIEGSKHEQVSIFYLVLVHLS